MGIIAKEVYEGTCDFPIKGCNFVIEDNIGDLYPIHIHMGDIRPVYDNGKPPADLVLREACPFYRNLPNIRLHFTYKEFNDLFINMKKQGRL